MRRCRKANFARTFRRSLAKGRIPSMALEDSALNRSNAFQRRGFLLRNGLVSISEPLFINKARTRCAVPSLYVDDISYEFFRQQSNRIEMTI